MLNLDACEERKLNSKVGGETKNKKLGRVVRTLKPSET
jgi:hypothetical protein